MTTIVNKIALFGVSLIKTTAFSHVQRTIWPTYYNRFGAAVIMSSVQFFSDQRITPNLRLHSSKPFKFESTSSSVPKVRFDSHRPLLVLLEYMNAKDKHVTKFVDFYMGYGFDVLRVTLKPWQLLWPVKGSQIVATDLADFLFLNESFSPLVLHGFSVGGYLWGEVLVKFSQDLNKYQSVADRISGQIFDSGVDVNEIPTGFPAAVFPKNPVVRNTFERYIRYHMRIFYEESTKHYIASRDAFTKGIARAPTLMIFSDSDPLSTPEINGVVQKQLAQINLPCDMKMFHGSKHVMHYQKYRAEYLAELDLFLARINVLEPVKLKAKL